jgi:hypothetical protein
LAFSKTLFRLQSHQTRQTHLKGKGRLIPEELVKGKQLVDDKFIQHGFRLEDFCERRDSSSIASPGACDHDYQAELEFEFLSGEDVAEETIFGGPKSG